MTDNEINDIISELRGYEILDIDYESFEEGNGLTKGPDGVWRTPSANKWLKQIRKQMIHCVGKYIVDPKTGRIYPTFVGPDTGNNSALKCDYANDLNEMHEAVESLTDVKKVHWVGFLYQVARKNHYDKDVALSTSTARQRAEAFIKTMAPEKWRDTV